MAKFKKGEAVHWNSESGRASGIIKAVETKPFIRLGKDGTKYVHHPTPSDPQYKIKSNKSDHIAYHKGSALHKGK